MGNDSRRKAQLEEEVRELKMKSKSSPKTQPQRKPLPLLNRSTEATSELEKCTSSSLKLETSPGAGRYFVANGDIGAAETVLVEQAKCASLYPKNFGTHCNHCFSRLVAPIGCTDCASVAFCSTECRDIALATYHKFECKYLDLLIGSGMSILCHLALKLVLQHQTPEKALEEGKRLSDVFCKNSKMRSNEDFFKRCLMTTFLLRCLQKTEFFGRRTTESAEPTPKEMEIGVLLFGYLQALQFNAHEIYETVSSGHKFIKSRINYIGVGIYEAGAMFNHECYPSITRYFNSTNLIFNSIRPHRQGEIVAENYGPIFSKQTLAERQRNLSSRYWFKCECRACRENWPVLDKLTNKCRFRCTTDNCEGLFNYPQTHLNKCRLCKQNISLEMSLNLLSEAEDLFGQGAVFMDVSSILIIYCHQINLYKSFRPKTLKMQSEVSNLESKSLTKSLCLHIRICTSHKSLWELVCRLLETLLTCKEIICFHFEIKNVHEDFCIDELYKKCTMHLILKLETFLLPFNAAFETEAIF